MLKLFLICLDRGVGFYVFDHFCFMDGLLGVPWVSYRDVEPRLTINGTKETISITGSCITIEDLFLDILMHAICINRELLYPCGHFRYLDMREKK